MIFLCFLEEPCSKTCLCLVDKSLARIIHLFTTNPLRKGANEVDLLEPSGNVPSASPAENPLTVGPADVIIVASVARSFVTIAAAITWMGRFLGAK